MALGWYYRHEGITHGPVPTEEVKALAAQGLLGRQDLLWREGDGPEIALPAEAALNFRALPEAPHSPSDRGFPGGFLPEWLRDVADMERKGPQAPVLPNPGIPEWLEDLRLWLGLDLLASPTQNLAAMQSVTTGLPDWIEGWVRDENTKSFHEKEQVPISQIMEESAIEPVSPARGPSPIPAANNEVSQAELAGKQGSAPRTAADVAPASDLTPPVPLPPQLMPAGQQAAPEPVANDKAYGVAPQSTVIGAAEKQPVEKQREQVEQPAVCAAGAPPVPRRPLQTRLGPAGLSAVDVLAKKTLLATGFDLQTGQVLDPEKFHQWKQQKARSVAPHQPPVTNASVIEVFRKARIAVEKWIDDEKNQLPMVNADLQEIKSHPEILAILDENANYGQEMRTKLEQHLEFLVENRRKYYQAIERHRTGG
jgi:hypothetical protein